MGTVVLVSSALNERLIGPGAFSMIVKTDCETDGSYAGLIQTLVNMCLTAQDLSRLGRPVPAPPSPESEYIPAVDSRWVLLSTDRCAAKCREDRPSRDLKIASRHFLPFSLYF